MEKYLILIGDEYGYDILNMVDLNFLDKEAAESTYRVYLKEYGSASMFLVTETKLELIKEENNFNI
jgi:hypothetical protein